MMDLHTQDLEKVPAQAMEHVSAPTLRLLKHVTQSQPLEAEWLNHLSQMEFVGCRKILKAVSFDAVDVLTLQHIQEEAGHSVLLKEAGLTLDPELPAWTKSRVCEIGWGYFQNLDMRVSAMLPEDQQDLAYPLVSFIVEERVMELYPAYRALSGQKVVRDALKIVLAQEGRHETRFKRWVEKEISPAILVRASELETELWGQFCTRFVEQTRVLAH